MISNYLNRLSWFDSNRHPDCKKGIAVLYFIFEN
jgi:hypothetical protein